MSIAVEELKRLKEEDCFNRKGDGLSERIVIFLKNNLKNAYTLTEIVDNINKTLNKGPDQLKYKKNSFYNTINALAKNKGSNIKRKGSYFYYEEGCNK